MGGVLVIASTIGITPGGADEMAYVVAGIVSKTDKGGIIEVTARSVPPAKVVERWRAEGDG